MTNLYDAQFREYGIQGRWPSPDPAGITAANPANPQSWNRYAYVLNNPLLFIDPLGLGPAGAGNGDPGTPPPCQVGVPGAGVDCSIAVNGSPFNFVGAAGDGSSRLANPIEIFMGGPKGGGSFSTGTPAPQPPCGQPNFVQRATISILGQIAKLTHKTVGFGAGISGALGVPFPPVGVAGSLSRQIVVSPNGQAALVTTVGTNAVPIGIASGVGFLGGFQFSVSNVQSPQQLGGVGVSLGGSAVDGLGVGADGSFSSSGSQLDITLGGGLSLGGAFGGAGLFQSTDVQMVCR